MSKTTSGKTGSDGTEVKGEQFKNAVHSMANIGKASTTLVENFALEAQKQWFLAAETYVKVWGQLTRTWLDVMAGVATAQLEGAQKAADRFKQTAE